MNQVDDSTLVVGSYPAGIYVLDLRSRSAIVQSGKLPKAPSSVQATPLCIMNPYLRTNTFMTCGRFPSVLIYDLRGGLEPCGSIYSGAESLSSMDFAPPDHVVVGGSYRGTQFSAKFIELCFTGRGTLDCVNIQNMTLEYRNRWTVSSAAILAVASKNNGVFAAGASGTLRILEGIETGLREINLGRIITRIRVGESCDRLYQKVAEQIYLGCGTDGVACVDFGFPLVSDEQSEVSRSDSLLAGEYSDMHYFGNRFM